MVQATLESRPEILLMGWNPVGADPCAGSTSAPPAPAGRSATDGHFKNATFCYVPAAVRVLSEALVYPRLHSK